MLIAFVVGMSLVVIALAVCVDVARDYWAERTPRPPRIRPAIKQWVLKILSKRVPSHGHHRRIRVIHA